jgi:hypothetical protein
MMSHVEGASLEMIPHRHLANIKTHADTACRTCTQLGSSAGMGIVLAEYDLHAITHV